MRPALLALIFRTCWKHVVKLHMQIHLGEFVNWTRCSFPKVSEVLLFMLESVIFHHLLTSESVKIMANFVFKTGGSSQLIPTTWGPPRSSKIGKQKCVPTDLAKLMINLAIVLHLLGILKDCPGTSASAGTSFSASTALQPAGPWSWQDMRETLSPRTPLYRIKSSFSCPNQTKSKKFTIVVKIV